MTGDPRLGRLSRLADLKRDAELAKVQVIAARRDDCLRLLAALDDPPHCDDPAALTALSGWYRWASLRRAELQRQLAAHQAELQKARSEAGHSVARAEVLARLLR